MNRKSKLGKVMYILYILIEFIINSVVGYLIGDFVSKHIIEPKIYPSDFNFISKIVLVALVIGSGLYVCVLFVKILSKMFNFVENKLFYEK